MLNTPTTITIQNDMKLIAKFDSNYYRDDVTNPFDYYYHLTANGTFFDPASLKFAAWKTFILGDSTSKIIAPTYVPFYNTTNASVVQALDGTYKDVYGNSYVGSITLQAYSSALLTKISSVITAPATPTPAPVLPSDTTITPMTSSYTFTITTSSAQQATLSIYYSNGILKKKTTMTLVKGSNIVYIDTTNYIPGTYIANVKTSRVIKSIKFVVN
jgi:hypothetical protein